MEIAGQFEAFSESLIVPGVQLPLVQKRFQIPVEIEIDASIEVVTQLVPVLQVNIERGFFVEVSREGKVGIIVRRPVVPETPDVAPRLLGNTEFELRAQDPRSSAAPYTIGHERQVRDRRLSDV